MKGCSGVIHLAAVSRVIWGERDPERCRKTNVVGTHNVIDHICLHDPQPWLIYGSSREVYGQCASQPVTEGAPLQPMNHYARSKVEGEQAVKQAMEAGIRASVLRFSTVYGSTTDHHDRVIPQFCRSALTDSVLGVEGAANSLDITHVSDVAGCIANVASSLSKGKSFEPMHLTTGHATSLTDLARTVVRLTRSNSEIITNEPRSFDVTCFAGDTQHATAQIKWRPKTLLETGLMNLIAEYLQKDWADRRPQKEALT